DVVAQVGPLLVQRETQCLQCLVGIAAGDFGVMLREEAVLQLLGPVEYTLQIPEREVEIEGDRPHRCRGPSGISHRYCLPPPIAATAGCPRPPGPALPATPEAPPPRPRRRAPPRAAAGRPAAGGSRSAPWERRSPLGPAPSPASPGRRSWPGRHRRGCARR